MFSKIIAKVTSLIHKRSSVTENDIQRYKQLREMSEPLGIEVRELLFLMEKHKVVIIGDDVLCRNEEFSSAFYRGEIQPFVITVKPTQTPVQEEQ